MKDNNITSLKSSVCYEVLVTETRLRPKAGERADILSQLKIWPDLFHPTRQNTFFKLKLSQYTSSVILKVAYLSFVSCTTPPPTEPSAGGGNAKAKS